MEYHFIGLSVAALLVAGSLRDCSTLSRYERETYDCSATQAPIDQIAFNSIALGREAHVEGSHPTRAEITQTGEDHIETVWGGGKIKVDRNSGVVLIIKDGMVSSYACKVSKFRM